MSKIWNILPLAFAALRVYGCRQYANSRTIARRPADQRRKSARLSSRLRISTTVARRRLGQPCGRSHRPADNLNDEKQEGSPRVKKTRSRKPELPPAHDHFGKVADTKEAEVTAEGKKETHFLAKITTYDNHTVIVDLGDKSALKTEVKSGDEIAAFGVTGRLNQRPLILAAKFATIVPIEGREEIFESVPVSNQNDSANSNQQFSQQALERSNDHAIGTQQQQNIQYAPPPFLRYDDCGCR